MNTGNTGNTANELITKTTEIVNSVKFKEENRMSDTQFTRNRKMNFKKMIWFCLNFVRKSLQLELDGFMELSDEDEETTITKQAFSKARQHISPDAFKELFQMTSKVLLNKQDARRYKGYRIFAIDGTELELSRSKQLRAAYPPPRNTAAPRARAGILCDVLSESIIHADIKDLSVDERTLALNHLGYYKENADNAGKGLFIFDRGYPSKDLISYFERNNLKYLMRLQKSFNKEIDETDKSDFYVQITNGDSTFNVRVIKLMLETGEQEILITNLARNEFKKSDFQKLYFLRWGVETKYNTIKNKLQIEDFSGKTVISVLQDFYASMYLSNMASAVKLETDKRIKEDTETKNLTHTYKTNENLLIGKLKNKLILILMTDDPCKRELMLNKLIERLTAFRVSIVPDRHFKRPAEAHKKTRSKVKRAF